MLYEIQRSLLWYYFDQKTKFKICTDSGKLDFHVNKAIKIWLHMQLRCELPP